VTVGPAVVLDDLTFDDLLRVVLSDIPGSSRGAWTLHGPVDPGITVLELYCWLFEQRLFMAGQTTEPVLRAALRLLGIADPRPAAAATTVLAFRAGATPAALPLGTVMNLDRDPDGRQFVTTAAVTVLPVAAIRAEGVLSRAGDVLDLVLTCSAVAPTGSAFTLLVDLLGPPGVAPGWAPGAPDVPPPAVLTWTAVGPGGASAPVEVQDGTGGFRRPGLLALAWPAVWGAPDGCLLRVQATAGAWTEPVRIRAVHPNASPAAHRIPRTADADGQLATFLPLPAQRLRLREAVGTVCDGPDAATVQFTETDGTRQVWTSVTSWTGAGPGDRVMLIDRVRGELIFGDGRAGRVPRPADHPASRVDYAVGAGPGGNLGAGRVWVQDGGAAIADSPLPAEGGADPETLEQARQRAGDGLGVPDRTVNVADAEALATASPGVGVARAHALPGLHPDFPCSQVPGALTLTVVPFADRDAPPAAWTPAPMPDPGVLASVQAVLARGRLTGQELFVLPPAYRGLTVRVTVSRTARDAELRSRIIDAVTRFTDPLTGGDSGDGWPFGGVVRPSRLAALVRATVGSAVRVDTVAVALDGGLQTSCDDLPIGPRELLRLDSVLVAVDAALPAGTGLL
jgi:hypothetical protein